ncbi:hypothetical protein [Neobacillus mesonae]|uniref:hypothetical protein n=1 Tax=Neobacillus mesonae TaxID=1193713 RepID=UPI00203C8707|nr:hypothetical protein [Neobacillus mesonae]MCM3568641.1 hypothetical protein [Neobacillus mesonae]
MSYKYRKCNTEEDFEHFSEFYVKRRHHTNPPLGLSYILTDISLLIQFGHIILGSNLKGEPIGFVSYFYGTPQNDFEDQETLLINVAMVDPKYRNSRAFIRGFQFLIDSVLESEYSIDYVTFYAFQDDLFLQKLYSQFATVITEQDHPLKKQDVYRVSFKDLCAYLKPFRRERSVSYDL